MILDILNLNKENPAQKPFSLDAFISRAKYFAKDHPLIIDTLKFLPASNKLDRILLLNIYSNNEIPFHVKMVMTFWWGGLSHQYQAPIFYQRNNLDKILAFSGALEADLKDSIDSDQKKFKESLGLIFNSFDHGDYKISGINYSYFTKILQFYFQLPFQKKQISYLPLIADKWSMRAVFAMMLEDGYDLTNVFSKPKITLDSDIKINFKYSSGGVFNSYWYFIQYFTEKVLTLKGENNLGDLTPFRMEEILFGVGRDWKNGNNPRRIYTDYIVAIFPRI